MVDPLLTPVRHSLIPDFNEDTLRFDDIIRARPWRKEILPLFYEQVFDSNKDFMAGAKNPLHNPSIVRVFLTDVD